MNTKLVTNEDQLLAMLGDITAPPFGPRSKTEYVVTLDTTKWDWEDTQRAKWLELHPHPRVRIDSIKHAPNTR